MKTIHKILVPTDFSECSLTAVDFAQLLAEKREAVIFLLHVVEDPLITQPVTDYGLGKTEVSYRLEKMQNELRKLVYGKLDKSGNIVQVVRHGQPHEEIIQFADAEGVDVIVMAGRGDSRTGALAIGRVAESVECLAKIPVLVVNAALSSVEYDENLVELNSSTTTYEGGLP